MVVEARGADGLGCEAEATCSEVEPGLRAARPGLAGRRRAPGFLRPGTRSRAFVRGWMHVWATGSAFPRAGGGDVVAAVGARTRRSPADGDAAGFCGPRRPHRRPPSTGAATRPGAATAGARRRRVRSACASSGLVVTQGSARPDGDLLSAGFQPRRAT